VGALDGIRILELARVLPGEFCTMLLGDMGADITKIESPEARNMPARSRFDYANRNMAGVEFLKNLPKDKSVQVGVLDVRSNAIESPQMIAARIKKVVAAVSPDRVVLSTDCGMKPLARMVAKMKLNALAQGAKLVRAEVAGVR